MFDTTGKPSPWRRIERVTPAGEVRDYVEVGACGRCGRGVDRAFPVEYQQVGQELVCAACVGEERGGPLHRAERSTGSGLMES